MPTMQASARANDAIIVRSRDAQCNIEGLANIGSCYVSRGGSISGKQTKCFAAPVAKRGDIV